jgi:type II secretory pathway pseudopilin PulG
MHRLLRRRAPVPNAPSLARVEGPAPSESRVARVEGLSLLEVTFMMTLLAALAAAVAPTVAATVRNARTTRAMLDAQAIRDAINSFKANGFTIFTHDGTQLAVSRVEFLYSDGDIPEAGSSSLWRNTTANRVNDFLEEHLITNSFNGLFAYSTIAAPVWRGAYLDGPVDPDPWGNRYAVNVGYLGPNVEDVVVISAGPDEAVDTPDTGNPLAEGDDDILLLVEA